MSDLVPDGATYAGPYGRFPVYQRPRVDAPRLPDQASDLIARLREEVQTVRRANEILSRERVEVEYALGRLVRSGELGPAVKMAIYRERGP